MMYYNQYDNDCCVGLLKECSGSCIVQYNDRHAGLYNGSSKNIMAPEQLRNDRPRNCFAFSQQIYSTWRVLYSLFKIKLSSFLKKKTSCIEISMIIQLVLINHRKHNEIMSLTLIFQEKTSLQTGDDYLSVLLVARISTRKAASCDFLKT